MTLTFDLWPFDPKFHRANTWLMGRMHVKFHEDRCKGEAVMRFKPFYLTAQSLHCDLDLWPFDPKVHRAHAWLMGGLHVKFHEDRWKGEAVMRLKPFYLTARLQTDGQTDGRTDGRTDGQGDSSIPPPNFVAGGITISFIKSYWFYFCMWDIFKNAENAKITPMRKISTFTVCKTWHRTM